MSASHSPKPIWQSLIGAGGDNRLKLHGMLEKLLFCHFYQNRQ